jgi:hypothetical protein
VDRARALVGVFGNGGGHKTQDCDED